MGFADARGDALRHRRVERRRGRPLVAGWAARPSWTPVAAIFPDGPQRYFETVFNDDYCRDHDLGGDPPGEPLTIPDPTAAVVHSWIGGAPGWSARRA